MTTLQNIATSQFKQALELREQIEPAQAKLAAILGGGAAPIKRKVTKGKRTMSPEIIEKMRAAQQARWAKKKGSASKA